MKILVLADVHHRTDTTKENIEKTLAAVKRAIDNNPADLIVFLGDTVYGPDFDDFGEYERHLREVLDLTGNTPFATVFGNHDDECSITKGEILSAVEAYPNALTNGRNFVINMLGETLLFIDSGSYYEGEGSYYDTVKEDVILWAKEELKGKKGILFQHIIMPDIMDYIEELPDETVRFKEGVEYTGILGEKPCPPDINTGELETLAPYLKAAVFGHDHDNNFEIQIKGVRFIQCAGAGYNSYEEHPTASYKVIDTNEL